MIAGNTKSTENYSGANERDVCLARQAAAGDTHAQHRLVQRLLPKIRRTMAYMVSDSDLVDDLTQLSLIRILRNAASYRGDCRLEYWAARVSTRVAINEIEKLTRQTKLKSLLTAPKNPFKETEKLTADSRLRTKLAHLLSKMSQKHRMALILKYIEGYSIAEIAQLVEAPENTVRERLRVGKIKLRALVAREPELTSLVREREQ